MVSMLSRVGCFLLVLATNPLLAGEALATQHLPLPKQLHLCIPEAPPYSGSELPNNGPLTEIVTRVFARAGIDIIERNEPWARIMHEGELGQCMILGLWSTPKRRETFLFSQRAVVKQTLGIYTRNQLVLEQLPHGTMAVERASYVPSTLLQSGWVTYEVTTPFQGLKMLVSGRVDALYAETGHGDYLIDNHPELQKKLYKAEPELEVIQGYLAIANAHPQAKAIMDAFNRHRDRVYAELDNRGIQWLP